MGSDVRNISLKRIDGTDDSLAAHEGKVLLIVNVASKCGLTPQYEGLEQLYRDKKTEGLEVLGFPANNFRSQEPGTEEEIAQFCSATYGVDFPMFSKISVAGDDKHPLYRALTEAQPQATGDGPMRKRLQDHNIEPNLAPDVLWNFEKFVVDRKGAIVARFAPDVTADDARLLGVIEKELAKAA
jgi:glutathione peroxidase